MKSFYKDRRELPQGQSYVCLEIQNKIISKTNLIKTDYEESEGKELTYDEKNSYISYLASIIYDYQLKLKYASICLLTFLTLLSFDFAYAQKTTQSEIAPLKIGDTIPEALWNMPLHVVNHPDSKDTIRLAEYRDNKVIILDFWATWCAPCIESLKKLSNLKLYFGNDLIVLPITNESEAKWHKFQKIQQLQLLSVIEEQRLQQYFPHRVVPHQIWIKDGKLLAKASAEYATIENTNKLLKDQEVKTMTYELEGGQTFDTLLASRWQEGTIRPQVYSALYHRIKGESSAIRKESNSFAAINFSIVGLFQLAFSNYIPFSEMEIRTVIEINDPKLKEKIDFLLYRTGDFIKDSILSANADSLQYTYVVENMNGLNKKSALEKMEQDVSAFFRNHYGLDAYISQRPMKCLVLERTLDSNKLLPILPIDSTYYRYQGVPALVRALRYQCKSNGYYVVDGVEDPRDISITLSPKLDDIEGFNKALSSYGLHLRKTMRELSVLVLTDGRRKYEI